MPVKKGFSRVAGNKTLLPDWEYVDKLIEEDKGRNLNCQNCNQKIKKVNGKFVFHTRRVFRRIKPGIFQPDYEVEPCPGGEVNE